jgi:hypothetical protein
MITQAQCKSYADDYQRLGSGRHFNSAGNDLDGHFSKLDDTRRPAWSPRRYRGGREAELNLGRSYPTSESCRARMTLRSPLVCSGGRVLARRQMRANYAAGLVELSDRVRDRGAVGRPPLCSGLTSSSWSCRAKFEV